MGLCWGFLFNFDLTSFLAWAGVCEGMWKGMLALGSSSMLNAL